MTRARCSWSFHASLSSKVASNYTLGMDPVLLVGKDNLVKLCSGTEWATDNLKANGIWSEKLIAVGRGWGHARASAHESAFFDLLVLRVEPSHRIRHASRSRVSPSPPPARNLCKVGTPCRPLASLSSIKTVPANGQPNASFYCTPPATCCPADAVYYSDSTPPKPSRQPASQSETCTMSASSPLVQMPSKSCGRVVISFVASEQLVHQLQFVFVGHRCPRSYQTWPRGSRNGVKHNGRRGDAELPPLCSPRTVICRRALKC